MRLCIGQVVYMHALFAITGVNAYCNYENWFARDCPAGQSRGSVFSLYKNNWKTRRAMSIPQCEQACIATPNCYAFTKAASGYGGNCYYVTNPDPTNKWRTCTHSGFQVWRRECSSCPAGSYCNGTLGYAHNCTAGTYSEAGSTSCTTCPPGFTSSPGEPNCTSLPRSHICSNGTQWEPNHNVCIATLTGILSACKKARGAWSHTCHGDSRAAATLPTVKDVPEGESGPRELPHRATGCDNATTIYDSNEEQCVVSYARSAQTCISGTLIASTSGQVSCGRSAGLYTHD